MLLSLIVALSRNGVIGVGNQLPWHLPEDLKYFKSETLGKPIIMGRKTFESIGKPLPGRTNIVITRDPQWCAPGVNVVHGLNEALEIAATVCTESGVEEVMVIGGEQIYRLALPSADRLYLTEVDVEIKGDAFFPDINTSEWEKEKEIVPQEAGDLPYRFVVLDRH